MGKWILAKDHLPSKMDSYIVVRSYSNIARLDFFDGDSFDDDVVAWYSTSMSRFYDEFVATTAPKEEYTQMTIDEWLANKRGE